MVMAQGHELELYFCTDFSPQISPIPPIGAFFTHNVVFLSKTNRFAANRLNACRIPDSLGWLLARVDRWVRRDNALAGCKGKFQIFCQLVRVFAAFIAINFESAENS
jgi:hypothetical protein